MAKISDYYQQIMTDRISAGVIFDHPAPPCDEEIARSLEDWDRFHDQAQTLVMKAAKDSILSEWIMGLQLIDANQLVVELAIKSTFREQSPSLDNLLTLHAEWTAEFSDRPF